MPQPCMPDSGARYADRDRCPSAHAPLNVLVVPFDMSIRAAALACQPG
jgi:hypothetical protein